MSYRDVAQHFGDLITRKNYLAAWKLLAEEAQTSITPEVIQAAVEEFVVEDWPDKRPGDLAVVYVALTGSNFSEAVTVTLAQYGKDALIRHLEWGRP